MHTCYHISFVHFLHKTKKSQKEQKFHSFVIQLHTSCTIAIWFESHVKKKPKEDVKKFHYIIHRHEALQTFSPTFAYIHDI